MDVTAHLQQVYHDLAACAVRIQAWEDALAQEKARLLRLDGAKQMLETLREGLTYANRRDPAV